MPIDLEILQRLAAVERLLQQVLRRIGHPQRVGGIMLAVPHFTRKDGRTTMPSNLQVLCDSIASIPVIFLDQEQQPIPTPEGVTLSASISDATGATVAIDANGNLIITPLVQSYGGLVATVQSSDGKTTAVTFDIVPDLTDSAIQLDVADVTTTPQAVPSAPGPGPNGQQSPQLGNVSGSKVAVPPGTPVDETTLGPGEAATAVAVDAATGKASYVTNAAAGALKDSPDGETTKTTPSPAPGTAAAAGAGTPGTVADAMPVGTTTDPDAGTRPGTTSDSTGGLKPDLT
jgi:hypothetical protein